MTFISGLKRFPQTVQESFKKIGRHSRRFDAVAIRVSHIVSVGGIIVGVISAVVAWIFNNPSVKAMGLLLSLSGGLNVYTIKKMINKKRLEINVRQLATRVQNLSL